jgi:hypothetical protein
MYYSLLATSIWTTLGLLMFTLEGHSELKKHCKDYVFPGRVYWVGFILYCFIGPIYLFIRVYHSLTHFLFKLFLDIKIWRMLRKLSPEIRKELKKEIRKIRLEKKELTDIKLIDISKESFNLQDFKNAKFFYHLVSFNKAFKNGKKKK